MKKGLLVIIATCYMAMPITLAQSTAGSTPNGMSILNPNISLSVDSIFEEDTASFDINCDGINDLKLRIYKGPTIVDGANTISLHLLNSSLEICTDTGFFAKANYYNLGDTLACAITDEWRADSVRSLGDFGCFLCWGPSIMTDSYVAFRLDTSVGWIKISFDIDDFGPITASISEVVQTCSVSSVHQINRKSAISLFPNPTSEAIIQIQCSESVFSAQVFNVMGQAVGVAHVTNNQIELPEESGLYFIKVYGLNDRYWLRKVIKK